MAAEEQKVEGCAVEAVSGEGMRGRLRGGGWVRWFVRSAGVVLLLTGLAKLWSAMGEARVLGVQGPLFGLTFRQLMLGVGLAEVVVAGVCLVGHRERLSCVLVGWLSGNFALYRLGLWWLGWKGSCGCLGRMTHALGVSPAAANLLMKGVLAYLLIGTVAGMWGSNRKREAGWGRRQGTSYSGSCNGGIFKIVATALVLVVARTVGMTPDELQSCLREPPAVQVFYEVRRHGPLGVFRTVDEAVAFAQTNSPSAYGRTEYYVLRYDGRVPGLVHYAVTTSDWTGDWRDAVVGDIYGRQGSMVWSIVSGPHAPIPYVQVLECDEPWDREPRGLGARVFWNRERAATEILRLGLFEILPNTFKVVGPERWRAKPEGAFGDVVDGTLKVNGSGQVHELRYEITNRWAKRVSFRSRPGWQSPFPEEVEVQIQWKMNSPVRVARKMGGSASEEEWQPYWMMRVRRVETTVSQPMAVALFDPATYAPAGARRFELDCEANWTLVDGTNRIPIKANRYGPGANRSRVVALAILALPTLAAAVWIALYVQQKPKKPHAGKEDRP